MVRAGLWEKDVKLQKSGTVNFTEIKRLAEDQFCVGLVTAGIEHIAGVKIPPIWTLQFIGSTLLLEQRNKAMNTFIVDLVEKLRQEDIYTLLVKGQGIAQCYEKPSWRESGDVDLFLSDANYDRAKKFLYPMSSGSKPERQFSKELGMNIGQWYVELHGSQRTGLSTRVDKEIDGAQRAVFYDGKVRATELMVSGCNVQVLIPAADEDVFLVFTHFVKHFYKEGGMSVRQLCDWCRLLYTYRESLNHELLESRIIKAGLMAEWRAFAVVAVKWLGMPVAAMPFFNIDNSLNKKAEKIVACILKVGEWNKWRDTFAVARIFPVNTIRFAPGILLGVTWMKIKERVCKR